MRSILRSSLSAVAVAASAVLLSLPAGAQVYGQPYGQPYAAVLPAISSFVVQTQGPDVQNGEYVRFRIVGTPGGQAIVSVPNLADSNIQLREVQPGIYELTRFVRHDESPHGFTSASAFLMSAGKRATAQTAEVQDIGVFGYGPPGISGDAPGWNRRWFR